MPSHALWPHLINLSVLKANQVRLYTIRNNHMTSWSCMHGHALPCALAALLTLSFLKANKEVAQIWHIHMHMID